MLFENIKSQHMHSEDNTQVLRKTFRLVFDKMLQDDVAFVCTIGLAADGVFELYKLGDINIEELQNIADYLLMVIEKYKARGN